MAEGETITCVTCSETTPIPSEGVDTFHQNIRLNDEVIRKELLDKMTGTPPPTCKCVTSVSVAYCMTEGCYGLMCEDCLKVHTLRENRDDSHKVITLEQAKGTPQKEMLAKLEEYFPSPSKCTATGHKENTLDFHCNKCHKPVCKECVLDHHRQHDTCKVSEGGDIVMDFKQSITARVAQFEKSLNNFDMAITEIQKTKEDITEHGERIGKAIKEAFGKLHELLHQRQQELDEETKRIVDGKVKRLDDQLRELKNISKASTYCSDLAKEIGSKYSDVQVLSLAQPLTNRADFLTEEFKTAPLVLCETPHVSVDLSIGTIPSLIQTFGSVYDMSPCPEKVGVVIPRTSVGRNVKMTVTIISKDGRGIRLKRGGSVVEARLKCEKETRECKVNDNKDGTYSVCVTSPTEGKHVLLVTINGHPVQHSPFPVRILPIHEHKNMEIALQTIADVKKPRCIAFSGTGQMYVSSETNKCIEIYDSTGKTKLSVIGSQLQHSVKMGVPHGLHVTDKGVYVADHGSGKVHCFALEGELKSSRFKRGTDECQLESPTDVTIGPDGNMYVCDSGNGRIQVFNSGHALIQVVNDFGSDDFVPNSMAFDLSGNLHITNQCSDVVKVISPLEKKLIRQYNANGVVGPSIAIDAAGYCYLAGGSRLVIVDGEGALVHSVDGFGSLTGVGVSPNGSVWLVDNGRDRVVKVAMHFINIE